jgi:hypothetical protein
VSCCQPYIQAFSNKATTVINYSQSLRDTFGRVPQVIVMYWDAASLDYWISHTSTRVALTGNPVDTITVDHGGLATGIIKII